MRRLHLPGVITAPARLMWRRLRTYASALSIPGMIVALLFFCFSMTPSLLPREWYFQGVASGICTVTGYTVGVLIAWLLRKIGFRPLSNERRRRIIRRVTQIGAAVLIPTFGVLGAIWQYQVRSTTQVDRADSNYYALVLLIAFLVARLLLSLARGLRWLTRRIGRFASRWIPRPVARLLAVVLVTVLVGSALADVLVPGVLAAANSSFSLVDRGTPDGVVEPTVPERSGSPASLVRWDDLGSEGRAFVGSGPTRDEIAEFTGSDALEPIRVYAGLDSAEDLKTEANLVVRELHRTGGFDRSVLVVATTTGRGWVNNVAASALEYLWGGDTAIAAMQYSYLPSPVAFLTDTQTPPEAANILLTAVRTVWSKLPAATRPKLLVTGESLGAFGSQSAFHSVADLEDQVDGAVWAGTPNSTELWRHITASRVDGSPEQLPNIDDCATICFAAQAPDIPPERQPRIVFLQHSNDPIVWWSADLLLRRPAWLAEPPQPGRTPEMTYIPFVTFWQLAADMAVSTRTTDGVGHEYGLDYANAFAAVVPPPDWTENDTARLRDVLAGVPTNG